MNDIKLLERRLDEAILQMPGGRDGNPMSLRRGRWYGKLTSALAAGGTCAVDVWVRSIANADWRVTSPAVNLTNVRSFFEVPMPIGFRVQVEFIGNTWAIVDFQRVWKGKADSTISKGSTGTVSLYEYNGSSMVDTGMNVTALALGAAVTSTSKWCSLDPDYKIWHVGQIEC